MRLALNDRSVSAFRYKSSSISLFHQALTFRKRGRVRNIWKLQDEIARNLQREPSSKDLAEITKPASISSSWKHMAKEGIDLIVHVQSSCISALLLKAPRAPALPRGSPRHLDASAVFDCPNVASQSELSRQQDACGTPALSKTSQA